MLAQMRGSRPALLLAAAALLLLVVIAARGESPVPTNIADLPLTRGLGGLSLSGANGVPSMGMPSNFTDGARIIGITVAVIAGILFVLAIVLSIRSALRNRGRVGVGHVVEPVEGTIDTVMHLRLKDAVAAARDTLVRAGGEPGDAVVAAWLTLENAASTARLPHQTATEFTAVLLEREIGGDEPAVHELRTLYQRARFGDGATEADARHAASALDRILAALTSEPAR
jgi:hypothetical protein